MNQLCIEAGVTTNYISHNSRMTARITVTLFNIKPFKNNKIYSCIQTHKIYYYIIRLYMYEPITEMYN